MKIFYILFFLIIFVFNSTFTKSELRYNWTQTGIFKPDGGYYLDLEKIKKIDNYYYVWVLQDFGSNKFEPYKSSITYQKLDCKLRRMLILEIFGIKEKMGEGSHIPLSIPEKWMYPPPGTFGTDMLNIVCKNQREKF